MQTIARSMADTGPIGGRYMPHAPPIGSRYGKRPHSRMRRLQLRTVHDLIGSPRAALARWCRTRSNEATPLSSQATASPSIMDCYFSNQTDKPAPHSRVRRLQLRTVHDLIGSPRAAL